MKELKEIGVLFNQFKSDVSDQTKTFNQFEQLAKTEVVHVLSDEYRDTGAYMVDVDIDLDDIEKEIYIKGDATVYINVIVEDSDSDYPGSFEVEQVSIDFSDVDFFKNEIKLEYSDVVKSDLLKELTFYF